MSDLIREFFNIVGELVMGVFAIIGLVWVMFRLIRHIEGTNER
jgi:hypothetical protein